MKTITNITAQKRRRDRVNIFLDGDYAFSLALTAAEGLKIGQQLTADEIAARQEQDDFAKAKFIAVQLIASRPRSSGEVRRHLWRKQYDEALVERVVTHLQSVELLDDLAFARYWVEQRETFKPRGRLALTQELMQKGVERSLVETAVAEVDEASAARRAAEKKAMSLTHLPEEKFRLRLGGYLQRRGFRYGIIKEIVEDLWQAASTEAADDTEANG